MTYDDAYRVKTLCLEKLSNDIDWSLVPGSLLELKHIAGGAAALSLVFTYGGCRIYMPSNIRPNHPLSSLLGYSASLALAKAYGGCRINIPKIDAILRQLRIKDIRHDRSRGASIEYLARKHNLSRRRVQQLLAQPRSRE